MAVVAGLDVIDDFLAVIQIYISLARRHRGVFVVDKNRGRRVARPVALFAGAGSRRCRVENEVSLPPFVSLSLQTKRKLRISSTAPMLNKED